MCFEASTSFRTAMRNAKISKANSQPPSPKERCRWYFGLTLSNLRHACYSMDDYAVSTQNRF